jgi:hypothetical protein
VQLSSQALSKGFLQSRFFFLHFGVAFDAAYAAPLRGNIYNHFNKNACPPVAYQLHRLPRLCTSSAKGTSLMDQIHNNLHLLKQALIRVQQKLDL